MQVNNGTTEYNYKHHAVLSNNINGIEIARRNIGGNPPLYNSVPFTDHESALYQNGMPDRITITELDDIINSGENTFALHGGMQLPYSLCKSSCFGRSLFFFFLSILIPPLAVNNKS